MPGPINACSTSSHGLMRRKASVKAWGTRGQEASGRQRNFSKSLKPRMAYQVDLTLRAQRDLAQLYQAIHAENSDAALLWYRGLKQAILRLQENPNRCPLTPENNRLRN